MRLRTQAAAAGAAALAVVALLACRLVCHPGPGPVAPAASDAAQTFLDPAPKYLSPSPASRKAVARIEAKIGLAHDVIAGRLALLPAAAAFRDLDREYPQAFPRHTGRFPKAASDDEIYCRAVIAYVGAVAPPDRVAEVTSGLEAELAARLRGGTLRLPEP